MLKHGGKVAECGSKPPVALLGPLYDFAGSANLSPYDCLKTHTCPICGQKGHSSTVWDVKTTFFYCKDRGHIFEINDDTQEVDRIAR